MAKLDPASEAVIVSRWPWVLGLLAALGLVLFLLEPILLPFVLGALIAYLGDPLVDLLEERNLGRTLGVCIVFVLFRTLIVTALIVAVPNLIEQLDVLARKIPAMYQWVRQEAAPWLQERLNISPAQLPQIDWSHQIADNWQSLGKMTAQTLSQLTGSGASLLLWLTNMALVPVVAFYLMRDWDVLVARGLNLIPVDWQATVSELVAEADEVIGAFLRGQFMVMCALAVIYTTGLWMVGVQLALLLGVLAGLASIVPYLGFVVGITASAIAAYFQFQELSILLWVGLVFGVGQMIESMVLTPVLVGDRIGLHPVAVIFALMAGGQLAGFVGVVLALPVAAVIMVFVRHALHYYRSTDVYGGVPPDE